MAKLKFAKTVATGNDFIIIDNRRLTISSGLSKLARVLCDRKYSIGADGLLLLESSKRSDFRMRIFNPDGSEAEMCGNGSRCAALYARLKRMAKPDMVIETLAGVLNAQVKNNLVRVKLTDPRDIKYNFCISIHKCSYRVSFANTGVPHTIYFVNDLEKVDVREVGTKIRYHHHFSPDGTNVDFVNIKGKDRIAIRTYERGVEDETLACGTGAVASAIISAESEKMTSPITIETRSGEKLKVHFEMVDGNFRNVYLEGKARLVFEGTIKI